MDDDSLVVDFTDLNLTTGDIHAQLANISFLSSNNQNTTQSSYFNPPTRLSRNPVSVRVSSIQQATSIAKQIACSSLQELDDDLKHSHSLQNNDDENVSVLSFASHSTRSTSRSTTNTQHIPLRDLKFTNNVKVGDFKPSITSIKVKMKMKMEKTTSSIISLQNSFANSNMRRLAAVFVGNIRLLQRTRSIFTSWKLAFYYSRKKIKCTISLLNFFSSQELRRAIFSCLVINKIRQYTIRNNARRVASLTNTSLSARKFKFWLQNSVHKRQRKLLHIALDRMTKKNLKKYLKMWRKFAIVTTAWLITLSFHKWRRLMKFHLQLRGRLRAKHSKIMKRSFFKKGRAFVKSQQHRRQSLAIVLNSADSRTLRRIFKFLAIQMRAIHLAKLRSTSKKRTFLHVLKCSALVSSLVQFNVAKKVLVHWALLVRMCKVCELVQMYYLINMMRRVVHGWFIVCSGLAKVTALLSKGKRRWLAIVFTKFARVITCKNISAKHLKSRNQNKATWVFNLWTEFTYNSKHQRKLLAKSLQHRNDLLKVVVLQALAARRAAKSRQKMLVMRARAHFDARLQRTALKRLFKVTRGKIEAKRNHFRGALLQSENAKLVALKNWCAFTERVFDLKQQFLHAEARAKFRAIEKFKQLLEIKRINRQDVATINNFRFKMMRKTLAAILRALHRYKETSREVKIMVKRKTRRWQLEILQFWRSIVYRKRGKRKDIERGKQLFERNAMRKLLMRFAYFSLRASAGYQIADRFKAKRYFKVWHKVCERSATKPIQLAACLLTIFAAGANFECVRDTF